MAQKTIEPHLFIILGALGDLTRRKLFPAVYHLSSNAEFGESHIILGVDVDTEMDDAAYHRLAHEVLEDSSIHDSKEEVTYWCECRLHYQSIGTGSRVDYQQLVHRIESLEQKHDLPGNRVFYLALPSDMVPDVIAGLGEVGLNESPGWVRIVMEKPFARDYDSSRELNRKVHQYFDENQIYRIDHFLGKESVQNLLAFRFANAFVEHLWNREHIESVEITVAEDIGIESRSDYYERTGALRDMIQNHLTQLMCLVAMEIPSVFNPRAIRYEKLKILRQIPPIMKEYVIFGQYEGYKGEKRVLPESRIETFAAVKLGINNWRWKGVPFYLRTGKSLSRKVSRIVVQFERAPVSIFHPADPQIEGQPNQLILTLQPDDGIDLKIQVKGIGDPIILTSQQLSFRYADAFGQVPDAYEHLILDIVIGDQTLFLCDDEVEMAWKLYENILSRDDIEIHAYKQGSWGPEEVNRLGYEWFDR